MGHDNLAIVEGPDSVTADLASDYRRVWQNMTYRRFSPGEAYIDAALQALKPTLGASFIDFGCGTGKPAAELRKRGYGVVGVDFADNCLNDGIDIPFLVADLTEPLSLSAEFGLCTDVMEHIEPEAVDATLLNICNAVRKALVFSIALRPDEFGPVLIGKPLHLTVRDADWWLKKLEQFWPRIEVLASGKGDLIVACFTWPPRFREDVKIEALCNTPDDVIERYIVANAARHLPFVAVGAATDRPAVIVGGGPSLARTLNAVRDMAQAGATIFALNNAANYLKEHGIEADWQIIIDSRPENVKFIESFAAKSYMLSAQCHPSLFDYLGKNAVIFYPAIEGIREKLPRETDAAPLICGMVTSGLQAMSIAFTLGYRTMHLHGYDSSDADNGGAHVYDQHQTTAEQKRIDVLFDGKSYRASFAMYKQAEEFEKFSRMLANNDAEIHVHGDGLLPAIARDIAQKQVQAV